MVVEYKRNSNLRNTQVGQNYLGHYVPPFDIDFVETTEMEITQKYARRPDIMAYDLYDDAKFWWIFTLFNRNNIVDPINDFKLGMRIRVPSINFITGV